MPDSTWPTIQPKADSETVPPTVETMPGGMAQTTGAASVPWRPPKACIRCGAKFTGRKCPACVRRYEEQRRGDAVHLFYKSAAWREVRAAFLRDHPQCVDCGGAATEADHLLSVRTRSDLALVPGNLVARCKRDHSRRTSREHSWNRR